MYMFTMLHKYLCIILKISNVLKSKEPNSITIFIHLKSQKKLGKEPNLAPEPRSGQPCCTVYSTLHCTQWYCTTVHRVHCAFVNSARFTLLYFGARIGPAAIIKIGAHPLLWQCLKLVLIQWPPSTRDILHANSINEVANKALYVGLLLPWLVRSSQEWSQLALTL